MVVATAIYLFSKNMWGSILLSVPFSALYMFVALRFSYHVLLVPVELGLQYIIINRIEKRTKSI
ncbi:hypothetical protein ACHOLT_11105 [Desulfitobacterium sp. Sab5]|uniref:hypothetical protein n=1 Tax=Desulfitobacterium nosdiversum TaxID=3375356 RepID=UPI003CF8B360